MKTPDNVLQNCKMPQGKLGEETLSRMNESHAELTAWAFSQIDMKDDAIVLDVGCGGGNALKMLSRRAKNGQLYGIDYSETSVEVAAKENKEDVASGKMEIFHGSVSELPFPDDMFDTVTTVESYYFWPDLPHDFAEVRRVLKLGGTFVIVAEMYAHEGQSEEQKRIVDVLGMHNNTPKELEQMLTGAGYSNVRIELDEGRGWLCAFAQK